MIFVFGSNLAGVHGAGAARDALEDYGAKWGQGVGLAGRSYAIPTKNEKIKSMRLAEIRRYVIEFKMFAHTYPELTFKVTRIGCGLAGFTDEEIAPMFVAAPDNCQFDEKWKPFLGENRTYWGTV